MKRKYEMLSIDAWGDDYGWSWNDAHKLETVTFADKDITPRKLFAWLRKNDYLGTGRKYWGKALLVEYGEYDFEIQERRTGMPVYAFRAIPGNQ